MAQGTKWNIPLILRGSGPKDRIRTVLLKADTGADMNLMNNVTFDSLFDRSVLQPIPIKIENYGNSGIKVLGKFHAFL